MKKDRKALEENAKSQYSLRRLLAYFLPATIVLTFLFGPAQSCRLSYITQYYLLQQRTVRNPPYKYNGTWRTWSWYGTQVDHVKYKNGVEILGVRKSGHWKTTFQREEELIVRRMYQKEEIIEEVRYRENDRVLNGVAKYWFQPGGNNKVICMYREGVLDGPWKLLGESGTPIDGQTGIYQDGQPHVGGPMPLILEF